MKYFLFWLLILTSTFSGSAQDNAIETDRRIKAIPANQTLLTEDIAAYINKVFTSNADKVRAAYTWVVHNIKYDTDSMYAINWNKGGSLKVTESLKRRRGVCENFASIFIDIISKTGLQGVTIDGYTKQGNVVNKTGHTWAAVNVDDTWYLFDPTWDKDHQHNYIYFMAHPASMVNSHMPFDPLWQLTDHPISHREFQGGAPGKSMTIRDHADSIKAFMRLGELGKLEATARRMNKADKSSDLIKNRSAFLQMQIATIYEETDMHLYNAAVLDLNKATEAYNRYVLKLNLQEASRDGSQEYNLHLAPALESLNNALSKIADIGKYIPNYQYDPSALRLRVLDMLEKVRLVKPQAKTFTKNR